LQILADICKASRRKFHYEVCVRFFPNVALNVVDLWFAEGKPLSRLSKLVNDLLKIKL